MIILEFIVRPFSFNFSPFPIFAKALAKLSEPLSKKANPA